MRIIRLKLDKQVKSYLREETRKFGIDDPGFTEDIFALIRLKGHGLPSKERVEKMSRSIAKRKGLPEISISLLISKRRMMFLRMLGLPYFHALVALKDPIDATNRFLVKMKRLYNKTRQAECLSCLYRTDCDFGKQYGEAMADIRQVIDPDFEKKIHQNCPALPEITMQNMLYTAVTQFQQIIQSRGQPEQNIVEGQKENGKKGADFEEVNEQAEELEEANFSPKEDVVTNAEVVDDPEDAEVNFHVKGEVGESSGVYDGSHSANSLCKVSEDMIDKLTVSQIALFDLGKKFSAELLAQTSGKFKPVDHVEEDKKVQNIERVSDITQLNASQHGLPDDVFEHRLEKRTLVKKKHLKKEDKKKILYILQDNSASMTYQMGASVGFRASSLGLYTRGALAGLFSLAIARRVRDDKGIVFHRFFTGSVSDLMTAKDAAEYEHLLDWIGTASYSMGSTNIPYVVEIACKDVIAARGDMKNTEILLITDCEDNFGVSSLKTLLQGAELNILDVAGSGSAASQPLKDIATRYYKADETAADVTKIVSLL